MYLIFLSIPFSVKVRHTAVLISFSFVIKELLFIKIPLSL
jgi:hypothetical protein